DAQLDNVNKDGNTPVLDCAQLGNYESLKLLLELQCNIRRVNLRHRSIVHLACILGMQKTQNQEQRLKILQLAFNERLDMDVADSQGNTALMYASHYGLQQLVSFLLDTARCDPNASNKNGTTAVHLATKAGHTEVLKILDKRKANLQATDSSGTTPIMIAVYYQRLEALKYLLETNFVEGAEDTRGRSLKTLAAFTSNAIREQLEKKAVQIDPIAQQPDILLENGVGFDIDTELCDHLEFQAQSNVDENEDPEILPDESVA
uniref:ANK_REP_REGION domain-containing protein n=1 Tax=Macrostomum lignano TaxID=282301 RepID=A0A1I8H8V7_9PLAT